MPYPYLNARIRAIEAGLLTADQIKTFCGPASLSDLITALQKAGYDFPFQEGLSPLRRLEIGIRKGYLSKISHLLDCAKGKPCIGYRIFLAYWDLHNLKTLIRAWIRRPPSDEVLELTLPASFLDDKVLQESLKQPSLSAMVSFWMTLQTAGLKWIRVHLRRVLSELLHDSGKMNLSELEMAMDRAHFQDIRHLQGLETTGDPMQNRWIAFQVDRVNLLTALRIGGEKDRRMEDPAACFISGGRLITPTLYRELAHAVDLRRALLSLPSPWGPELAEALPHPPIYIPPLLYLEFMWDCLLLRVLSRCAVEDPLSGILGLSVLQKALRELKMLRLMAVGMAYGIPVQEMEDWVDRGYRCGSLA